MKIKRIILFFLCLCLCFQPCALADTDVNVDGSGGTNMGSGTGTSYWSSGDDGVRVTVIDRDMKASAAPPIDFSNKRQDIDYFFGYQYKLKYMNGAALYVRPGSAYKNYVPNDKLPKIIYGDGTNNIQAIKRYFGDENTLRYICSVTNFSYDDLVEGNKYCLLIEPIAYFTYNGKRYAMTATEAAKRDQLQSGKLKAEMGSLTHCNLPRSMYLQWPDLGIEPPEQPFKERSTDYEIIDTLGVGIIRFDDELEETIPPTEYDYFTDNDVITSFFVKNPYGLNFTPDDGETVKFFINGDVYEKEFVCPASGYQLIWINWHTPKDPCTVEVKAEVLGREYTAYARVVEFPEVEPPNPEYYDKNEKFKLGNFSKKSENTKNEWEFWEAVWIQNESGGYWSFIPIQHRAELNVDIEIKPDDLVKTAVKRGYGRYEMKSAYGVNVIVKAWLSTSGKRGTEVTNPQIVSARFPEFEWQTYNRLLEYTGTKSGRLIWELKENPASYYSHRVHFTPLWYPDKTDYPVYVDVYSVWTPAGQLFYSAAENDITIDGNVYDDWYIRNY